MKCILSFVYYIVDTILVPVLIQQLANIDIPDVSGSTDVSVVGKIDYSLSRLMQYSNINHSWPLASSN